MRGIRLNARIASQSSLFHVIAIISQSGKSVACHFYYSITS
jgi:hypothetical protein